MAATGTKGYEMEEALRSYFLQSGYYVIRGMPLVHEGDFVTDVDLWLYSRGSPLSRELAIVDIKNKKQPQAMERILWVAGLKRLLGVDKAIVATTDRRASLETFARQLDVQVLNGNFLSKVKSYEPSHKIRISEEEFIKEILSDDLGKFDGDWKKQVDECRAKLLSGIDFDTFNYLLIRAEFFLNEIILKPYKKNAAIRCLYLILSYSLICMDYLFKELSFRTHGERNTLIFEGIKFGTKGKAGLQMLLGVSSALVTSYLPDGSGAAAIIKKGLLDELNNSRAHILADYLSESEVNKHSFGQAKLFEQVAMSVNIPSIIDMPHEAKSYIGCLCDYWGFDRVLCFDSLT
ncbi:hypothetical protein [Shewanella cutis]|uniref:Restriction endonuclease type IV Mrr domain-containing protein n=1 Tax=Shewanella cutis TaxID=2766780 RepID=A0ABS9QXU9_9GAMM|nr:hypothetical protein [Shewanella sp. PS-2]MCG9965193.1 hypothetical protein [Shewanella sp. PS-2]